MKRILLIIVFAFLNFDSKNYAQSNQLDSLLAKLTKIKPDSQKVHLLNTITYQYLFVKSDSALYYAQQAEKLAQQLNLKQLEAFAIYRQGLAYRNKGDLAAAIRDYQRSSIIAEKVDDKNLIGRNISSIGSVYYTMGNYGIAYNYYQTALEIFEQLKNSGRIGITLSNLGNVYLHLGKYDSAQYVAEKALPLVKKYEPEFQPYAWLAISEIKFKKKEYEVALKNLQNALAFAEKYSDKFILSGAYQILAEIDCYNRNYSQALENAQKAAQIAEQSHLKAKMYLAFETLSKIFEAQSDWQNALKYNKLFVIYKDSVQSEITKNALQIFEHEKKQGEIALLKNKQATQLNQQRFFTWLAVLSLGVMFVITSVILYSRQKTQAINRKLQVAHQQIQEKQEEILAQNEELRVQKEEIAAFNAHLGSLIEEKTQRLTHSNQKLTEYAFFNAHKLRSPMATILGLYEVLNLNPSLEEQTFIFEQIKIYIKHLDEMVHQSQKLLDDAQD